MYSYHHSIDLGVRRCHLDMFRSHEVVELDGQVNVKLATIVSGDVQKRTKNRVPMIQYGTCDGGSCRI